MLLGVIKKLNLYDVKTKHGFIEGRDGNTYYFNEPSIGTKAKIESFYVNDEVVFDIEATSSTYSRAINLKLVISEPTIDESKFYSPGIVRRIDQEIAQKSLKPDSGEWEAIKEIEKLLAITRIGYHQMDKVSRYEFCLAGTTEVFKQFIPDSGEFIIVFSHFDGKSVLEKTFWVERELRKRREISDRRPLVNFYILVCDAPDLIEKVNARKGEASASIIPFSFDEICACKDVDSLRTLMLSRFAEFYFENNMLGENDAIDDDNLLFGDRGKIADTVVARCFLHSNSGIFGLRRSGKTSVLNAVLRRLDRNDVPYVKIESRTYETASSWQTVLFDISCSIRAKLLGIERDEDETIDQFYKRLNLSSSEKDYEKRGVVAFIDDVQRYTRDIDLFVIAVDEIELITYNSATSKVWKDLVAYKAFWSALRDCGCPLIVCGVNSTINEKNKISFDGEECDNPMYGRLMMCQESVSTYLPSFTDEQTKQMINTLGAYSNIAFTNVSSLINRAFGGQPWAIRQFCSYVFENVKEQRELGTVYEVTLAACENLMRQFQQSAQGVLLCETILQHVIIYREEYVLLKKIALNPDKYNTISGDEVVAIDHLLKYGLIERDTNTEFIVFRISIIKDYIQKNEQKEPEDMDNKERRQYIQDYVAVCERKLKTFIRNYYSYVETPDDGRTMFLQYINATARQDKIIHLHSKAKAAGLDPNTCDFADFFNHKKFVFYFSALKRIILDNWTTLGLKFTAAKIDRAKFTTCMEDLNAGRNDADHYDAEDYSCPNEWDIDDVTMRNFCAARNTMDSFFKKYSL